MSLRARSLFITLLMVACSKSPESTGSPTTALDEGAKVVKPTQSPVALPQRAAPPPVTPTNVPHLQQTDNSPPAVYAALAEYLFSLEHVQEGRSTQSIASSRAAWIADDITVQN